jgi:hypothetical protein
METTTGTQAKVSTPAARPRRGLVRGIVTFLIAAFIIGFFIHRISIALDRSPRPAGFLRGVLQGMLMPASLPNLLVGNDVIIYAQNNTGRTYKLGYTVGVNVCGAFFFGTFLRRVNRLREKPQMNTDETQIKT